MNVFYTGLFIEIKCLSGTTHVYESFGITTRKEIFAFIQHQVTVSLKYSEEIILCCCK